MTLILFPLSLEFELVERTTQLTTFLISISLSSTLILSISKIGTEQLLTSLLQNFFRLNQKEKEFKEALKIGFRTNTLLLLNFIVTFTLCSFLYFQKSFDGAINWLISLGITLAFLVLQIFVYRFVAFITGTKEIVEGISIINKNTWQFGGILMLALSYVWILDAKNYKVYGFVLLGILLLMLLLRIIKGILFSFNRRISWYYFILYLCTLEILPTIILLKIAFSKISLGNVMVE
jgi:hypothetical protein